MIDPIILLFILLSVLGSIGLKLGYDPVFFILLCGVGGLAIYMINYLPIQLSQWIIIKLAGG